jgi:hypothetical protein
LGFAAGEILGTTRGKIGGAGESEHLFDTHCAGCVIEIAQPEVHVGGDAEVREERGLLRDQRGVTAAGREMQTDGGVSKRARVEGDAAAHGRGKIRRIEAGE